MENYPGLADWTCARLKESHTGGRPFPLFEQEGGKMKFTEIDVGALVNLMRCFLPMVCCPG